jgi:bacteriorhodopsin
LTTLAQRIGTFVWVLIFGGLFVVGIGVGLERAGEWYHWAFIGVGAAAVVAGCVLIWVRSRMSEP